MLNFYHHPMQSSDGKHFHLFHKNTHESSKPHQKSIWFMWSLYAANSGIIQFTLPI